jgi:predicted permease
MARAALPAWLSAIARLVPARYRAEVVADLIEERDQLVARGRGRLWIAGWLVAHLVRSALAARVRGRRPAIGTHRPWTGMGWGRELRQAARSLRQAPWYTATIVAVTALSMALAATVFAIVDGVLFKPLPYPSPDEIHVVSGRFDDLAPAERGVEIISANEAAAWSAAVPDLAMTSLLYTSVALPGGGFAHAVAVDRAFFEVFGVQILMGGFTDEHYLPGQNITPVLITYQLWMDRFGGDPAVVGRVMRAAGPFAQPFQVVGILAADGFVPPLPAGSAAAMRQGNRIDAIRPAPFEAMGERSSLAFARIPAERRADVLGRLNRAVAALRDAAPALRPDLTEGQRRARAPYDRVELIPLAEFVSTRERPVFALAFAAVMSLVCLVLLNAGALSAARAHQRIRDLALRRALGARLRDLLRHALAEQALLITVGAAAGVIAAPALLAVVVDRLPPGLNLIKDARLDWRVLVFAGLLSAAAAIAVALLSVRVAVQRATATPSLSERHGDAPGRARVGRVLIAAQTAIAFALVLCGSLFVTSLARIWDEDPGIEIRNTAIVTVLYPDRNIHLYPTRALDLAARLRGTPGVAGATLLNASVLENSTGSSSFRSPPGAMADVRPPSSIRVSSGFFETAGVRVISGRLPSAAELDSGGAPVVVVSETAARTYWPGRSALGQTLGSGRVDFTVIGVVRDVRLAALDIPSNGVIFAPWSGPLPHTRAPNLLLRLDDDAPETLAAVLERIRQLDPNARLTDIQTLRDAASTSIRERRLTAFAASIFAGVALVFVVVGVLGLVAMTASRRTREVGIRLALGATRTGVVRLLLGEQLRAVAIGLAAGGMISAWAVRLVGVHLYGVGIYDAWLWFISAVVVVITASVGAWLPARRASAIDPTEALRQT